MFNKVFISYAREDFQFAEKIYKFLESNNFNPWMDKEKLMIGHKWEYQIMNELRIADFIIILLSKTSVAKRGFVQKEFKNALKYAEEKLNSDIFILPIKIDDCEVPSELAIFNWEEFKNDVTFSKIIQALNFQRNEKISSIPIELITLNDYTEHEVKIDGKINSIFNYDIKYPIFPNVNNINTDMLNVEIKHYINTQISFLNNFALGDLDRQRTSIPEKTKYTLEISYSIGLVNNEFASILFYEFYDFLGAHPNHSWTSINIGFRPDRILNYANISNLKHLGPLIKNYRYEFDHVDQETIDYNIESLNEYSDNLNFHPKKFQYFLLDSKAILINFSDHLPHVAKALGQFEFKYKIENGKILVVS